MASIRATAFAIAVFAFGPRAQAGDAVTLLGGVGSTTKAAVERVCFRPWRAYWYPAYVYSGPVYTTPAYESLPYPYPQPFNGSAPPAYQPMDPPPESAAPPPLPPARPGITIGFAGRRLIAAIVLSGSGIRVDAARPPSRPEQRPPSPRPDDSFRYDGGPANPVPMPDGSRPGPTAEPSLPAAAPFVSRVKATPPKTRIPYPAFGDDLPRRPVMNPLLVKYPPPK